jgi:RNA polymerase sigma-70 factor (ECF subfamily)
MPALTLANESMQPEHVRRAVGGDEEALEDLLQAMLPSLRARIDIRPDLRRSLDPEDVLQVSCLEAFLRIRSLRDPTPPAFRSWIQRIVDNNLRDAIKGLERDKRPQAADRVTHGPAGESARTLLLSVIGAQLSPTHVAATEEQVERLRATIERLPKSYREVVELMDLQELGAAEVAERMGRSKGAVHLLRSRAHDRLRDLLAPDPRDA